MSTKYHEDSSIKIQSSKACPAEGTWNTGMPAKPECNRRIIEGVRRALLRVREADNGWWSTILESRTSDEPSCDCQHIVLACFKLLYRDAVSLFLFYYYIIIFFRQRYKGSNLLLKYPFGDNIFEGLCDILWQYCYKLSAEALDILGSRGSLIRLGRGRPTPRERSGHHMSPQIFLKMTF